MKKAIFTLIFFIVLLLSFPGKAFACTCLDPWSFFDQMKNESIILHIQVDSTETESKEVKTSEDTKQVTKSIVHYRVLNNISNSNIPNAPFILTIEDVVDERLGGYHCYCDFKYFFNTHRLFEENNEYLVLLDTNDKDELYVYASASIDNNVITEELIDIEAGAHITEVTSSLTYNDTNDYQNIKTELEITFEDEEHELLSSIILRVLFLSPLILINLLIATFLYYDANKINPKQALLWGIFGFFTGFLGFIMYLFIIRRNLTRS